MNAGKYKNIFLSSRQYTENRLNKITEDSFNGKYLGRVIPSTYLMSTLFSHHTDTLKQT